MYTALSIVDGFPGKSASHGAFGWSSLWLIEGEGRRILVDTGPPAYVPLIHRGLEQHGLSASEITDVMLTHTHWDHIGNLTMFPTATPWIGQAELTWATLQPPGTQFLSDLHVRHLDSDPRVQRIDGESEILPGIFSMETPGHTPGHLAYVVTGADGPSLFAGDAVKNLHELTTARADSTMDADESRRSIERVRSALKSSGGMLIPGHDVPLVASGDQFERAGDVLARFSYFDTEGEHDSVISIPSTRSSRRH
jgi:N-acyl homoserine lactone hydrolase